MKIKQLEWNADLVAGPYYIEHYEDKGEEVFAVWYGAKDECVARCSSEEQAKTEAQTHHEEQIPTFILEA